MNKEREPAWECRREPEGRPERLPKSGGTVLRSRLREVGAEQVQLVSEATLRVSAVPGGCARSRW